MRKKIIIVFLIFLCMIIQYTIMPAISIASVSPNLMISVVVSFGLIRGNREGMWIGFVAGLMVDCMYMILGYYVIGFRALIYMFIGYSCGYCYHIFYDEDVKMPVLLTAIADFLYGMIIYGTQFLLRGRVNILFYLKRFIIPEMLYTILITLIIYRFLLHLNHRIDKASKRRVDSFV